MAGHGSGYTVTFTVADGSRLDAVLDREVATAMAVAYPQGLGVLLTRHDARTFTLEASPEVPAGTVSERDLRQSPGHER
jgi:hypothetical protein